MMNEWLDEIKLMVACKLDRDESLQCSSLKPLFYFFGGGGGVGGSFLSR